MSKRTGDIELAGIIDTADGVGNDVVITTSAASPSGSSGSVNITAANSNAVVNSLIAGQDESNYTFDFGGGTGHAVSDIITMADGSTVTVDAVSTGVVTQFTVTTSGGVTVQIQPHPTNLTQSSTTGSGTGFFLQPQGDNVVQDSQTGGDVTITAGDGGTSTTGGGDVTITSGRQRGTVLIETGDARTTGNGAYAGKIDIRVGTSFQNSGENVNIFGGNADYEGGDAFGGDVRIVAGNGFATIGTPDNSYGGDVSIEGGAAQYGASGALPYDGGDVNLHGGRSTYYGGNVNITSGATTGADGIAGNIILQTPNGGYGASIRLIGGNASFASAAGADIRIVAGNSASGHGGDVEFTFGTAPGDAGAMVINTSVAPTVTTNKLYNIAGALTWNGTDLTAGGGGISNVVEDTTPQLGGNLDVNGFNIVAPNTYNGADDINLVGGNAYDSYQDVSSINITAGTSYGGAPYKTGGDVNITAGLGGYVGYTSSGHAGEVIITGGAAIAAATDPAGSVTIVGGAGTGAADGGDVVLQGGTSGSGSTGAVRIPDQAAPTVTTNKLYSVAGALTWNGTDLTAGGGIAAVVDDTTPQLGGQLDVNGNAIGDGTLELITFTETGSAVNQINIANAATAGAPVISAAGGDANIDISIQPKGTGNVVAGNFTFDGDQTVGAGQDNFVLTYDNGSGLIALEAAAGGGNSLSVTTVTTTTATAAAWDAVMVDDDTAGSTVTITLPAGSTDDQIVVKKLGTTANVIIDGDSAETIDGAATFTLTAQYASLSLIWNGTEWSII